MPPRLETCKIDYLLVKNTVSLADIAQKLAFVDVETTGSTPDRARVTEVAIVTVQWPRPDDTASPATGAGMPAIDEWHSLVNPGIAIPPEIRFLTGIDNEMVRSAPTFAALANEISARLEGAVLVAHHARFDYGFIKGEMARAGRSFQVRTLCTVRLSRALDAQRSPHTLDALIMRWRLQCPDRHRALGDARVLWALMQAFEKEFGAEAVASAARRLISRPNLPAHLNVQSIDAIPAAAGIYFFYGLNEHPLYIGKSRNIRQRIASHFCNDYQSSRGVRLASETRALRWIETPGEFSALLAEIHAIAQHMPAHNVALRRQQSAFTVSFDPGSVIPRFIRLDDEHPAPGGGQLGPFGTRAAARSRLVALGRIHGWCLRSMGLERGHVDAPCFARQLGRCAGACVGAEPLAELAGRIARDIVPFGLPEWPAARLLVVEQDARRERSAWHLFDHWCWQESGDGTKSIEHALSNPPATRPRFDRHALDLLIRTIGTRGFEAPDRPSSRPDFGSPEEWASRRQGQVELAWCWLSRSPTATERPPS